MHPGDGLNKYISIVESCTTDQQINVANKFFNLFFKTIPIVGNGEYRLRFYEARNKMSSKIWRQTKENKS